MVPVSLHFVSVADAPLCCSKVVAALETVSAAVPLSVDIPVAFGPLSVDVPDAVDPLCLGVERPSLSKRSNRCCLDHNV